MIFRFYQKDSSNCDRKNHDERDETLRMDLRIHYRDLRIGEEVGQLSMESSDEIFIVDTISDSGHETDALGHTGDERRRRPRKITGSCQTSVDP